METKWKGVDGLGIDKLFLLFLFLLTKSGIVGKRVKTLEYCFSSLPKKSEKEDTPYKVDKSLNSSESKRKLGSTKRSRIGIKIELIIEADFKERDKTEEEKFLINMGILDLELLVNEEEEIKGEMETSLLGETKLEKIRGRSEE